MQRRGLRNELRRRLSVSWLGGLYTYFKLPGVFNDVTSFCLFIGHGRSGSTLVGALLNAHPEIVFSNELGVLDYLKPRISRDQLFRLIYFQARRQARQGSKGGGGYTYKVAGQWQGRHRAIRVIGDRKAGATALHLFHFPERICQLQDLVAVPIKFIAVVRNPFDTLATTLKKTERLPGEDERMHLSREIQLYFDRSSAIRRIQTEFGSAVTFVHHEDFVGDASSALADLCAFLHVESDESYFNDCAGIVNASASITRTKVAWTAEQIDTVVRRSAEFSWLERYRNDGALPPAARVS